jgi:hypothetical protein
MRTRATPTDLEINDQSVTTPPHSRGGLALQKFWFIILHIGQVIVISILILYKMPILANGTISGGERIMSLKSATGKTCVWCVAIVIAALTLLAVTWTVILFSNY